MAKRPSRKQTSLVIANVPQSLAEVEQLYRETTNELLEIRSLETDEDTKIAEIHAEFAQKIGPKVERVQNLAQQIYAYAEAHKQELSLNGTRLIAPIGKAGTFQWARLHPSVVVTNVRKVIVEIVKRRLRKQFLRQKYEIDKEAILKQEARAVKIPGISIERPRKWYIRPADTDARVEMDERTGTWQIAKQEKKTKPRKDE